MFKANKYTVLAQGEPQKLNAIQKFLCDSLTKELNFFLLKKNIIIKILEEGGQDEVFGDELKSILEKSGKKIQEWGTYEATIDGEKVFIRPGSKKPKGWQITFRGRNPEALLTHCKKGMDTCWFLVMEYC